MIDLPDTWLGMVRGILAAHFPAREVWAHGSRVAGGAVRLSDLDIVLRGDPAPDWRAVEGLRDAFSESDLPISVDVAIWGELPPAFQRRVEEKHEVIQRGAPEKAAAGGTRASNP
ncbi:MAG TPA: nucleotidyltransferase domain-containing protein [Candidatus Hydrogenedentes bacterium]|nr:nucleotidyltransferase domain-containing protein [Candidatus Hydrogenedentota bacterium]HRZ84113.1 nucleotidyltransferase domain-containing protein [Candidatus Hydrogenedentota bacterium]